MPSRDYPEALGWAVFVGWYFFPAMLLNLTVYLSSMGFGQASILPIDLRKSVGGNRLIGDGRGLSSLPWALVIAGFCSWLQGRGAETLTLACGAQAGMVVLSLAKRRLGKPRGTIFAPWDHIDFVLGAILFQAFSGGLSWSLALGGVAICGAIHWLAGGAIKAVLGPR